MAQRETFAERAAARAEAKAAKLEDRARRRAWLAERDREYRAGHVAARAELIAAWREGDTQFLVMVPCLRCGVRQLISDHRSARAPLWVMRDVIDPLTCNMPFGCAGAHLTEKAVEDDLGYAVASEMQVGGEG